MYHTGGVRTQSSFGVIRLDVASVPVTMKRTVEKGKEHPQRQSEGWQQLELCLGSWCSCHQPVSEPGAGCSVVYLGRALASAKH